MKRVKHPTTLAEWQEEQARLEAIRHRSVWQESRLAKCRAKVAVGGANIKQPGEWEESDTNFLCDHIADGGSFPSAAKKLGRTNGSISTKWRKIIRGLGWQAV